MSKNLLRNEDFKSSSNPSNIQGMYYRGEGFPIGRIQSPNTGALYLDNLSGQLWICSLSNSTASDSWRPFFADVKPNIAIDTDVMNGDIVGIFGVGAWAASTALPATRAGAYMVGNSAAALVAGGYSNPGSFNPLTTSVIFNGSTWNSSGNMAFRLAEGARAGSPNAAVIAGGGNGTVSSSLSFLYDGSTWATGNPLSQTKEGPAGNGTQAAAWCAGGANAGGNVSRSEVFNGTIWSFFNAVLSATKGSCSAIGAQNAAVLAGGANTPYLNVTEIFNGSAWSIGPNLNISRDYAAGSGTLMSGWVSAGQRSGATKLTSSELFNGSTWTLTGNVTQAKDRNSTGAGGAADAMMAGGLTTAVSNKVELHSQSVYRRLNFSNARSAANIGMAYGVSTTSLTASLLNGDLPSTIVPSKVIFGINKFRDSQTFIYTSAITGTVLSVSASTGTATLNLSTTMTNCFWNGAAVLIKHANNATGTKFPIIGGTDRAPIVRWVNASSTSVSSFTFSCVYNGRFTDLVATDIQIIGDSSYVNFSTVGNISATTFGRWVNIGDIISIPYSSAGGLSGSQYNYGTYLINFVDGSDPNFYQVGWIKTNTVAQDEAPASGIGGITIYQQLDVSSVCLDQDALRLGMNNKMHVPMLPFHDDMQNGIS
jgi:hypothetical protein